MAHDIFISYSSKDKPSADAACAVLESAGLRCWIAPRDIRPGDDWGTAIVRAISTAKVFVLIFSTNANESPQIRREVERAVNRGLPVIPMRIENVSPTDALEYFINTPHWLDAFTPPLSHHLQYLAEVAGHIVQGPGAQSGEAAVPRPAPRQRRRLPLYFPVGALLFSVLLAGTAYRLWPRPPPPQRPQRQAAAAIPAPSNSEAIEITFWSSVAASNNAAQLQSYLRRYPKGLFADLARDKIAGLNKPPPPPARIATAVPPRPAAKTVPAPTSAPAPESPYIGWWRAAQGTGTADFGGAPYANYRTILSGVSVSIEVSPDGTVTDGIADGMATEIVLSNNASSIPPNKHVFRLLRGEVTGDDVTADFQGDSGNQPPTRARLRGHFRGSDLVATFTVDRANVGGVVPQVLWSIAIPFVLRH